ncbi:MAG: basic membrane protein A [Candidatus Promineifilaceae bacterium]|jgi:basic membrane protein A
MYKKLFTSVLVLFLFSMLACVSNLQVLPATPLAAPIEISNESESLSAVEKPLPTCADEELLCIGLVIDAGQINDKSFNQSAWKGAKRAEADLAARVDYVEALTSSDPIDTIEHFVEKDYDVIVTVGFNWSSSTIEAAQKYPEIYFVGVDQYQAEELQNIVGLIFPEAKAGFLAGALAAMISETGTIGGVFGTDIAPPIVAFKEGFEAGAYAINPEINVLTSYHPGEISAAFSDPIWGAETARGMLDEGADVIFAAGGRTGNGALVEVATNSEAFCIGVDADQWLGIPEAQPCLVSSAMKQISNGVFELIARSLIENTPAGNFIGEVELAPFHGFDDSVTAEAKAVLKELDKKLAIDEIPLDGSYIYKDPPSIAIDR